MSEHSVSKEELQEIKAGYTDAFITRPTPAIKHFTKKLFTLHRLKIEEAARATNQEDAFRLLQQANGIMQVVEDIETYTSKKLSRD